MTGSRQHKLCGILLFEQELSTKTTMQWFMVNLVNGETLEKLTCEAKVLHVINICFDKLYSQNCTDKLIDNENMF